MIAARVAAARRNANKKGKGGKKGGASSATRALRGAGLLDDDRYLNQVRMTAKTVQYPLLAAGLVSVTSGFSLLGHVVAVMLGIEWFPQEVVGGVESGWALSVQFASSFGFLALGAYLLGSAKVETLTVERATRLVVVKKRSLLRCCAAPLEHGALDARDVLAASTRRTGRKGENDAGDTRKYHVLLTLRDGGEVVVLEGGRKRVTDLARKFDRFITSVQGAATSVQDVDLGLDRDL